jgi:phosphatidate cytidylyltransferase
MMLRALTALVMIPTVVWVALASPYPIWFGVTALVAALSFIEYRNIAAGHGLGFSLVLGLVAGLGIMAVPLNVIGALPPAYAALGLAIALRSRAMKEVLPSAAGLLFGLFYVFGSWRASLELGHLDRHWLLYAMALNWVGDIAAYLVGRAIGKHRLAPVISPNKSWEGAIASVVGSAVFGVFYLAYFLPKVPALEALALTALANAAGQIGDLSESAMKRGAGVKDSGSSLPGHGGWLDRTDSTLFAVPVVYLWVALRASF